MAMRRGDTDGAGFYRSFNPSLRLFAKRHNLLLNQYGLFHRGAVMPDGSPVLVRCPLRPKA